MNNQHLPKHKSYRLQIKVIEERDVYRNKEDFHGGPGYYPDEVVLVHSNQMISDAKLSSIIHDVARGEHDLVRNARS
jgi:hypothetical protein